MVVSVNKITDQELDKYDVIDQELIPSKDIIRNFGDVNDYVEAHLYSTDGRLLESDYRYKGYLIPSDISIADTTTVNSLIFDPAGHVQSLGYTVGSFKIDYRVYRKKIFDLAEKIFFINEISSDRKEIRIISNYISDDTVEANSIEFIREIETSTYFKDFLLNFGDNKVVNAVNLALDKSSTPYSLVIKLYQPLPTEFDLKTSLWVVEELSDPIQFEVELALDPVAEEVEFIGPANFNISLDSEQAISSDYQTLNSIYSTNSLTDYQNIVNRLKNNSAGVNIDYSDFSNFIHFSSAAERLNNFVYKLQLIEDYNYNINVLKTVPNYTSGSISSSIHTIEGNITGIVEKFDGYETYLYTVSESNSWPKVGAYPSYSLLPTTSSAALYWLGSTDETSPYYGGMLHTASIYDLENQDNLVFSIPEYISEDENNQAYLLFMNMAGQHFDNIWVYIKAINDLHKANNSFKEGISKDMVYNALRSLGIKLYNNNTNENIFDYFIGNVSGSYTITGSHGIVSGEDRSKELFKRLYHNLPYLLKSKGTNRGIKALISTFGIPDTILSVNEYGGSDKFSGTMDYSYDRFSYALFNSGSSNLDLKWAPLTQNKLKYDTFTLVPDSVEFRFKPDVNNIPQTSTILQKFSDSLNTVDFGIVMDYTSSNGIPSANVRFLLADSAEYVSSSLTLPIYATGSDGDSYWWNVLLRRNIKYSDFDPYWGEPYDTSSIQQYDLIVKNSISGRVAFQASASIYATGSNRGVLNNSWSDYGDVSDHRFLTIGSPSLTNLSFPSGSNFNGHLQEVRYWSEPLSDTAFDYHVLNGESYEGNYSGSAFNDLAARFPLGNNLVTYNHSASTSIQSVHPNYTVPYSSGSIGDLTTLSLYGSAIYGLNAYGATGSLPFFLNENKAYFFRYPDENNYDPFYNVNYASTPNSGYYNPVTEKVRVVDNSVNSDVLSPMVRMETPDVYRTKDVQFLDVSFSPQNEINKDIIAEFGSTLNIDNIIGDPSKQYDSSYDELSKLNSFYYSKFADKFNLTDFIRFISSVDNTLFKMIEDYVPARSRLSTGITVKSPILERNRVQRQKPIGILEGTVEGHLDELNIFGEAKNENVDGSTEEFITGELQGSVLDLQEQFEKNNTNPYLLPTGSIDAIKFYLSDYNTQQGVVTQNVTSSVYKKIDPSNDEVLAPAEVQDGYYSYKRHSLPRYEGSKSTSQKYNVYTVGDNSYGKNAAIDYNVLKFGWVNSINPKNLNFYNKTTLNLKHLINESGSLTELNTDNKNLFEVQNTFKSGDQVVVSLFDKTRPTNQSSLNGSKEIFLGGFSYTPILFRDLDETLFFEFLNPTETQSLNLGIKAYATTSYQYSAYDDATVRNPTEAPVNSGAGYFFRTEGITTSGPMSVRQYSSAAWPYTSSSYAGVNYTPGTVTPLDRSGGSVYAFDLLQFDSFQGGYNTEPDSATYQNYGTQYYYLVPRSGPYTLSGSINFGFKGHDDATSPGWSLFKVAGIVEKTYTPYDDNSWTYVANTTLTSLGNPVVQDNAFEYNSLSNTIYFDKFMYTDWNFTMNMATTASLSAGEYLRYRFYIIDIGNGLGAGGWNWFEFNLRKDSFFEVYDSNTKISKLVTTGSIGQIPSIFTYDTSSNKGIIFNSTASLQFYTQSVFIPQEPYSGNYSPVTEIFEIQPNDLFRFGEFTSPTSVYYEVESVTKTPQVVVTFKGNSVIPSESINSESFAILRKVPDETSVILNFNKLDGETSKALLIPNNLTKRIADNVANIVQPLKVPLSTE